MPGIAAPDVPVTARAARGWAVRSCLDGHRWVRAPGDEELGEHREVEQQSLGVEATDRGAAQDVPAQPHQARDRQCRVPPAVEP